MFYIYIYIYIYIYTYTRTVSWKTYNLYFANCTVVVYNMKKYPVFTCGMVKEGMTFSDNDCDYDYQNSTQSLHLQLKMWNEE
jgi:hypothetical protein